MPRQLIIGLAAEGSTDYRFLPNVIQRTFEDIAYECTSIPEFLDVVIIVLPRTDLTEFVRNAVQRAYDSGAEILCLHHDADASIDTAFRRGALAKALAAVENMPLNPIPVIVPVVPVRTLENWLLADVEAVRQAIGTNLDPVTLGIQHPPESYGDPKAVLAKAIAVHEAQFSGRRRRRTLADLYLPLSRDVSLERLRRLPSFEQFYQDARQSLIALNILR